jgi:hypothetical protein
MTKIYLHIFNKKRVWSKNHSNQLNKQNKRKYNSFAKKIKHYIQKTLN